MGTIIASTFTLIRYCAERATKRIRHVYEIAFSKGDWKIDFGR
jgi:hypothetical protein